MKNALREVLIVVLKTAEMGTNRDAIYSNAPVSLDVVSRPRSPPLCTSSLAAFRPGPLPFFFGFYTLHFAV